MRKDFIPKIQKTGRRVLSIFLSSASILAVTGGYVLPTSAAETTDEQSLTATISGSKANNQTNTIVSSSYCDGSQSLSGTDAEVFKKVVPDSDGDIICVKSDGFRTEVSGTSDVKNYHWTAWYKKNLTDDIDTTNDLGNYRGFNAEKVKQWSDYKEEVMALNGGAYPEVKDYTYPTDTTESKLDFWGDIAGYYSVLADPQYKNIHLTAYQQFSYQTRHEVVTWVPLITSNGDDDDDSSGSVSMGDINGTSNASVGPKYKYSKKCVEYGTKPTYGYKYQSCTANMAHCYTASTAATAQSQCATLYSGGSAKCGSAKKVKVQTGSKPYCKKYRVVTTKVGAVVSENANQSLGSNEILGKITKQESSAPNYTDEMNGDMTMQKVVTYVYTWETKEVKVAEADIAQSAYATELGTMPRISLKAGSGSTYTINSNKTTFWNTTPRYWTDGGQLTASNDSTLPYHFESEDTAGTGVNNVNLYSTLSKTDKLYTLIHGYPNITETNIPDIPNPNYPNNADETCVEVNNDTICSKKQTPPIHTEINIDDDDPQGFEDADKEVHLTKSQETQDEIKSSKNTSSSDNN